MTCNTTSQRITSHINQILQFYLKNKLQRRQISRGHLLWAVMSDGSQKKEKKKKHEQMHSVPNCTSSSHTSNAGCFIEFSLEWTMHVVEYVGLLKTY